MSAAPITSTHENATICESQVEPTKAGDEKTRLARWLLEAVAAGDLDSARMVHRMLGERLAAPTAPLRLGLVKKGGAS